jgi:DNA-binding MarR family transcriptional regulator
MGENFDCGKRIIVIANKVRRFLDASVARIGLTGPQAFILHFIYVNSKNRDIFQRDIEAEFDIRRSSVTGILHGLERGGFIQRESVKDDARLKKLTLTEKAVKMAEHTAQLIDGTNVLMIKNLKKQDIDYLDTLLAKIEYNIP